MPQEPQELAANEWGAITYPQWDTLELAWGPQTRSMTDDGFKQTLQIMADHGLKVRPKRMIIDATQFSHTLGEGTLAWRDERIAPLYNDAGVEKFAFLTTASMPGTVEKGADPRSREFYRSLLGGQVLLERDPDGHLIEVGQVTGLLH